MILLCYVTSSSRVMLCYFIVMLCYCHVTLLWYFVMLWCGMLCYVLCCYGMLYYVMLCYVMLCYVMLCYVMLCYVMLCYGFSELWIQIMCRKSCRFCFLELLASSVTKSLWWGIPKTVLVLLYNLQRSSKSFQYNLQRSSDILAVQSPKIINTISFFLVSFSFDLNCGLL